MSQNSVENLCEREIPVCIWEEVLKNHERHARKLRKMQPNSRIRCLALPRKSRMREKYQPPPVKSFKREIEIVQEWPLSTRNELLAMPTIRQLMNFKKANARLLQDSAIKEKYNKVLCRSLYSMYSRLSCFKPPDEVRKKRPQLTEKELKKINIYFKKLAKPKKPLKQEEIIREERPLFLLRPRMNILATPKKKVDLPPGGWFFKKAMKTYMIKERTKTLASPKVRATDTHYRNYEIISPNALKCKASERVSNLAQPKKKGDQRGDQKENPYEIPPNVLKYKPTSRIKKLAKPKEFEETNYKDPMYISPAALNKAKMTPRLEELAKPKERTQLLEFKKDNPAFLDDDRRKEIHDKLFCRSLYSMYSRLSCFKPPVEVKEQRPKLTADELKKIDQYFKKISKPKVIPKPPPIVRKSKPLKDMKKNINILSKPKKRVEPMMGGWFFKKAMRTAKPSDRTKELANPKRRVDDYHYKDFTVLSPNALKCKASDRTKNLAQPKKKGLSEGDRKENPFEIAPNALKYRPTSRIKKLAKPKTYESLNTKDPMAISPAALKAKASPRTEELAQPKPRN